jgi:hypothetical protein
VQHEEIGDEVFASHAAGTDAVGGSDAGSDNCHLPRLSYFVSVCHCVDYHCSLHQYPLKVGVGAAP